MTQKLSALKFIKNNKRQVFVMVLALGLTFMAMYVLHFILMTTQESFQTIYLTMPEKITFAELTGETLGLYLQTNLTV